METNIFVDGKSQKFHEESCGSKRTQYVGITDVKSNRWCTSKINSWTHCFEYFTNEFSKDKLIFNFISYTDGTILLNTTNCIIMSYNIAVETLIN